LWCRNKGGGRYLALLAIKLAGLVPLSSFDIESVDTVDGKEPKELMGFTMPPTGLRCVLGQ
jgi:hypothetical protein